MSRDIAGPLGGGLVGGACAALITLWVVSASSPPGSAEIAEVRRDLVALSEARLIAFARVDERLAAIEARLAAPVADAAAREALAGMGDDLRLLRDAVELELRTIDEELERMAEVVAEVAGAEGGPDPDAPLDPVEEPRWVVLAGDHDSGVRFSALVRLGRRRTDRSVGASVAALADPVTSVVWVALRNLGAFRDRSVARAVAALLDHEAPVIRLQAHEALLLLGLPQDLPFDPVADADRRRTQAERILAWADE